MFNNEKNIKLVLIFYQELKRFYVIGKIWNEKKVN